jgi:peroxiredoxin
MSFKHYVVLPAILGAVLLAQSALALANPSPAQNFTLKSAQGSNIRLSEYRGQVVLVNFWASWCGPCRQEFPHLDDLHRRYAGLGFTVFGVNVEQNRQQAEKVLRDIPVTFPILFDDDNVVSKLYSVDAMPMSVLIDRAGNLRYVHRGYKPGYEAIYDKQIRALIKE